MKLPDRLYDVLKWICMICIPACTVFYVSCAAVWGWPYADEVAKTSAAVCTLLGSLLGISTAEYNRTQNGKHLTGGPIYGGEEPEDELHPKVEDILGEEWD